MSAEIQLNVTVNGLNGSNGAFTQLHMLEEYVKFINKNGNIQITVNDKALKDGAKSLSNIASTTEKAATASAKLALEEAKLATERTKLATAESKLAEQQQKTALATAKVTAEAEKRAAAEKKAAEEAQKAAQKSAQAREEAARKKADAERKAIEDGLKAWEQYEKEQERLAEQEYDRYLKEQQAAEKAAEAKIQADSKVAMAAQLRSDKEVEEAQKAAQAREQAAQRAADRERESFERAQESVNGLISRYSTLSMHIDNLIGRYPAGTFDEVAEAVRRNRDALQGLNDQYASGAITQQQYIDEVNRLSTEYGGLRADVDSTASSTERLQQQNTSLWRTISDGIVSLGLLRRALKFVISEVKEALSTMKDVDTELTKIRKVTNQSPEEIEALGDRAYATASKYGVAANEYLSAAADFAKAGYSNYDTMAELATKTQLVGDVTADVASRFLLSADAAWKFNGNIESLSSVLDKANTIENNYATSLEKLADGFPIVASTAAMANMSIDETMAALGTITSVTQESGRKAATALRALILNIMGEVGAEVEEGVEVTAESVKSLDALLNKYASDAVKAAQDAGKVIDPMQSIYSIAKAYQDGLMTEAELADFLSAIGGKLRTNQLTALVDNWGTYEEMLEKVRESAGSADEEIAPMLDSWDAKTNILKNSWVEFFSTLADTKAIKYVLDVLNAGFSSVNSGNAAWKLFFSDITGWGENARKAKDRYEEIMQERAKEFSKAGAVEKTRIQDDAWKQAYKEIYNELNGITEARDGDTKSIERNTKATVENTEATEDNAGATEDAIDPTVEYARSVNALYDALNGARDAKTAFDTAMEAEEKDDVFKGYAEAFKKLQEEIDAGRVNSNAFWAASEFLYGEEVLDQMGRDAEAIAEHTASLSGLFGDADSAGTGLLNKMSEMANESGFILDNNGRIIASIRETDGEYDWWIDDIKSLAEQFGITEDAVTSAMSALGVYSNVGTKDLKEVKESAEEVPEDVNTKIIVDKTDADRMLSEFERRVRELESHGIHVHATIDEVPKTAIGIQRKASGTSSAPGGATLVNEAGPELISDNGVAYIANGGRPAIVNLSRGASVLTAHDTKSVLGNATSFSPIPAAAFGIRSTSTSMTDGGSSPKVGKSISSARGNNTTPISVVTTSSSSGSGSGSSSGGSSGTTVAAAATSGTSEDAIADALKTALSLLDEQAELADNQKRHSDEAKLYKQAQDRIQQSIDEYLANGYEETSLEVVQLKNQQYDYLKKQTEAAGHVWEEIEDSLDTTLDNIDAQIDLIENDPKKTIALAETAKDLVDETIKRYIDSGYSETSDEVLSLMKKSKGYEETIKKANDSVWKALEDTLDKKLSNIDSQIELSEDPKLTQSLAKEAQGLVNELMQKYLASGYSKTSDEVLALMIQSKSYQETYEKAYETVWKNIKDSLGDQLDSIDAKAELAQKDKKYSYANELYREASDLIDNAISDFISNGFSEDSDEVVELRMLAYEYADKIIDITALMFGEAESALSDELSDIDARITLAKNRGDSGSVISLQNDAQDAIQNLIDKAISMGYAPDSAEVVALQNQGYSYASAQSKTIDELWSNLLDAIDGLTEATDDSNALAEKQLAFDEAKAAYENALTQRNVRIYNRKTGQWEWVANSATVQKAYENMQKSEEALRKEELSKEIEAIKNGGVSGLSSMTIGPALSAAMSGADATSLSAFATALNAVYGGVNMSASTNGTSPFGQSSDSHDTIYSFPGGITLTSDEAEHTTLAQLARQLSVLGITS